MCSDTERTETLASATVVKMRCTMQKAPTKCLAIAFVLKETDPPLITKCYRYILQCYPLFRYLSQRYTLFRYLMQSRRRGSIIGRTDESSEKSHNFNEIKQYLMNTLYLYFSGIINLLILHTTNIYFFFEEKVLLKSFVCNIILLLKLGKKLFFV